MFMYPFIWWMTVRISITKHTRKPKYTHLIGTTKTKIKTPTVWFTQKIILVLGVELVTEPQI